MKKVLTILGLSVAIVALAGYFVAAYFLGGIVKGAVNNVGPKLTQSPVELASASISPFSGVGTLSRLTVGNPAGWSSGRAFYLGEVHIDLEPRSVFGDPIVINDLVIDAPEFNYETKFVSSNIKDLLNNIEAFTGKGGKVVDKQGKERKFIVRKLRLTNGKATVGAAGAALPVPLPEIRLDDIGVREGGVTGGQLAQIIMRDVLSSVVSATAKALGQLSGTAGSASLEKTKEAAKQLSESVKDLFKKKEEKKP